MFPRLSHYSGECPSGLLSPMIDAKGTRPHAECFGFIFSDFIVSTPKTYSRDRAGAIGRTLAEGHGALRSEWVGAGRFGSGGTNGGGKMLICGGRSS